MVDLFEEIYSSLRKNKLRTFLTGFSVAWGIFILVLLLGAGNGLKNGVTSNFAEENRNNMRVYGGYSSMPYKGFKTNRSVEFNREKESIVEDNNQSISAISPQVTQFGTIISYKKNYSKCNLQGTSPRQPEIDVIRIASSDGRFINELDIKNSRKSIVLYNKVAKELFGDENPIGKNVAINGILFNVVGIYSDSGSYSFTCYIPSSTAFAIYNPNKKYNAFDLILNNVTTLDESTHFKTNLTKSLSSLYQFNEIDKSALHIWDRIEQFVQTNQIFGSIQLFIWLIGIGTLIAGIVGVSNIMLITVKERTHEFGIRKALGAPPMSILMPVLIESLLITLFFGYIGMVGGVIVTEGVSAFISSTGLGSTEDGQVMFKNPTIEISTAIGATLLLSAAGVLAGYFPARKAIKIKPIEAIRTKE